MSYKTELQELQRELAKIKDKKKQAQKAFFKIVRERIQDDFPFHSLHENIFESLTLSLSTNGKFKASKTTSYNVWFLDYVSFHFYHEKGQAEKVKKARQIIEKLYEGEDDEKD